MKRKVLIEGMSCNHCSSNVKATLEVLNGISEVEVLLDEKCAIIIGEASEAEITEAIDDIGFAVTGFETI